jgi:hypothetical protein
MSVKERLREYIKRLDISERAFCLSIDTGGSFVNNIRLSIAPDKLERIAHVYPDLNLTWLMTGHGEMLNEEKSAIEPVKPAIANPFSYESKLHEREKTDRYIESLNKVISTQDGLIDILKSENQRLKEEIAELQRQLHGPEQHSKAV